jgi:hypothetical protein
MSASHELHILKHVPYNAILRLVSKIVPVYIKTYELSHRFLFCAIGYLKYLVDFNALRKLLAIARLAVVYAKAGPRYKGKDCHAQRYEMLGDQRRNSSHQLRYR